MRQSTEQRRLLAEVVADIVGYSRLMAENEADTFYRVKDFQNSLITPALERNHGRVVKWTGDGFLATFDSAVDAVRAAVEIQSGAASAGASAADDRRIRFRIGINAGDVIMVPGDVYGDTVNVAARLETLATPGGICISRGVRDTVRGKFSVEFEDRGELAVKNIPDPVGTFSVIFDPIAWTIGREETPPRARSRASLLPRPLYLSAAALALVVGAVAIGSAWYFLGRSARGPTKIEAAQPLPAAAAVPSASPLHDELMAPPPPRHRDCRPGRERRWRAAMRRGAPTRRRLFRSSLPGPGARVTARPRRMPRRPRWKIASYSTGTPAS
jgi:adenylate cyclase